MVVDRQGLHPVECKIAVIAQLPTSSTVEEMRVFLGKTGYLRQIVKRFSVLATPLTDILRGKASTTKRAKKSRIPWDGIPRPHLTL